MPSRQAHEAMADKCQATMDFLLTDKNNHSEWIAVIAFYKALHLVESLFAELNVSHDRNHESRENALKSQRRFNNIYQSYRKLWSISTIARYLTQADCFSDYMSPDDVENKVVRHWLRQVEKSVNNLMPQS